MTKYVTTLKRHTFKDRPDWVVVNESVPLGTEYQIFGLKADIYIKRLDTGEERQVLCYLVTREGDNHPGYIPCDVFND